MLRKKVDLDGALFCFAIFKEDMEPALAFASWLGFIDGYWIPNCLLLVEDSDHGRGVLFKLAETQ